MGGAVPLRARPTAIFGALVLAPDTMLLRLSAFESSSEWLGSWGIVFYRAWGRLVFIPLMCPRERWEVGRVSRRGQGARSQAPVAGRGALHGPERRVHRRREHDVHRVGPVHRRHGPALLRAVQQAAPRGKSTDAHVARVARVRGMGAADIRRRPGERRRDQARRGHVRGAPGTRGNRGVLDVL